MLNELGQVYWSIGNLEKALDCFNESLSIRQAIGDREGQGEAVHNLGVIYSTIPEFGKALEYHQQALSIERELGDRRSEASTLNNMGVVYESVGEYQKALQAYDNALPIRRETGDRRGEAYTLKNIGGLHADLGDQDEALKYYERALPVFVGAGDRMGEISTLNALGEAYAELGQHRKTLDYYQQALALSRASGMRRAEGNLLNSLGLAYGLLGDSDKALESFSQALQLRRTLGHRGGEAETLNGMAGVYLSLGKTGQALDYYSQALLIARSIGWRSGEVGTLAGMARAQASERNLTGALRTMESALALFESFRGHVASRELRSSFLSSASQYYEDYIDLLMNQHAVAPSSGYDALALRAAERARARSLVESLAEAGADIRQGIDAALLSRQRGIERQLSDKEGARARLLASGQDKAQIVSVDKELDELLGQLHQVDAEIRASSPGYAALTRPTPLSAGEIQHQLLDADTLLLEYSLGREHSYLWAITPTSSATFELPKKSEIDSAARRAYELLVQSNQRIHRRDGEVALADLARMVLGPVATLLGTKRLLIVPDGALHYVPFEALPEPLSSTGSNPGPLIASHEVTYLPSASVLAELRRATSQRRAQERSVAVLADPVFGENDPRVSHVAHRAVENGRAQAQTLTEPLTESELSRSVSEIGGTLERLPFARREAEVILHLSDNRGLAALDFKANRETAMSPELERYRVVHFATHALINSKHPDLSGIVLSLVDQQGHPQNGFLAAHDIYNLKLGADLVVLSACRTALGKEMKGEGLVSIVRGFMYAGAPRVVASLWDVRDEAAAELMKRFYQGFLIDRLPPAAALRAAKVSMLKEKQWESPFYWAAFVLQGECK